MAYFRDRRDAGRQLAQELLHYADRDDAIVLALPRGGVPVAYEVALAYTHRWMCSLFGSLACRVRKNWPSARSPRGAYAS